MAENQSEQRHAYVSFSNFKAFLEHLKATAIPAAIDYTAMPPSMADGTKGHLRATLSALGLIDPKSGSTQPGLRALVKAIGTPDWSKTVDLYIVSTYGSILGDLDLTSATPAQLRTKFAFGNAKDDTIRKAVRFFLNAAHEAGRPISKLIGKASAAEAGGISTTKVRRSSARSKRNGADGEEEPLKPQVGEARHQFQVRKGVYVKVLMPEDINAKEMKRVAAWLATIPLPEDA